MYPFDLKHQREQLWRTLQQLAHQDPVDLNGLAEALQALAPVDRFWTFPGLGVQWQLTHYLQQGQYALARQLIDNCMHQLEHGRYRRQPFRPFQTHLEQLDRPLLREHAPLPPCTAPNALPYFEVLVIHPYPDDYEMLYRQQLAALKSPHDEFVYDIVLVNCAEDALTAVLNNTDIQACVYLNHVPASTLASQMAYHQSTLPLLSHTLAPQAYDSVEVNLCRSIRGVRPELQHYLISELSAAELAPHVRMLFDRVLFHVQPFQDLHAALLNGVRNRYSTPFFDALQAYSRQPRGVFHALPLSRGASVKDSPWIHDMLDFYGSSIFLAETSSTQGGLDSLLDPTGAIKQAHAKAAQAFGADHSYFVTNGTSTSNKIVFQANVKPGDIVLISADCHKSIPYAAMLAGAHVIFLETYPLEEHDLYGAISLAQIKAVMLDLRQQGRLEKLRQITLTNSTFDGLIYHSEKFMMEILALKPDVIFHWDEAWSASAHFHPLYHSRMAMSAVSNIRQRLARPDYVQFQAAWQASFDADPNPEKWQQPLYPAPMDVRLRVYVTQSTHKTLTAFRQGSMIHVADDLFDPTVFLEAFRIHTSTSPNYQIIASLDIGRRQASLEGFHLVRDTLALAVQLRQRIAQSDILKPYFDVLDDDALVPGDYRRSSDGEPTTVLGRIRARWGLSDFVVDPTRVTLNISRTGLDGSSFRQLLMSRYDIQINKTSRHTVLFLVNIGATQATIDYLMQVLVEIASRFGQDRRHRPALCGEATLALPEKRSFHAAFMPYTSGTYAACDIRKAYFEGGYAQNVGYLPLSTHTLEQSQLGARWVSASFVTPYPPGFPVLVPGQIITPEILAFFQHIKVKEIHGFHADLGFKVFTQEFLAGLAKPVIPHEETGTI